MWKWLKKELREILQVWIFFFVAFALLTITFNAIIDQYYVDVYQPPEYLVGSLIVAKSVVLIDPFLKRKWLRGRPLIYVTLWNSVLYFVAALVVHHVEQVLKLVWRQHVPLRVASRQTFLLMTEPRYWGVVLWLFAVIVCFCTIRELIGVIGKDRFVTMFFRPRRLGDIRKVS